MFLKRLLDPTGDIQPLLFFGDVIVIGKLFSEFYKS